MREQRSPSCPECGTNVTRRDFVRLTGAAVAASAFAVPAAQLWAAPASGSAAETAAKRFYDTLTEEQRRVICLPYDHELRRRINANWHVTKPTIDDKFFTDDQRAIMREIFRGVTSPEGFERFHKQMDDDSGGFGAYSVAVFGSPGEGKFEWIMTGRHLTIRADGDSNPGAAFGGPIVYGHGEEDPKHNLFHYQTKMVNEVFAALDAPQREKALLASAPAENAVLLQGAAGVFPGIAVSELASDQQELIEKTIRALLAPYRDEDVEEALAVLKSGGGLGKLHVAFYKQGDLGGDGVWDVWRLEGPSFVWHFRGAPHVHTYVNIGLKQ